MDKDVTLTIVDEKEPNPMLRINSRVEIFDQRDDGSSCSRFQTRIFLDDKDISGIIKDVRFHHSAGEIPMATLEFFLPEIETFGEYGQFKLQADQEDMVLHLAEAIKEVRARDAKGAKG